MLLGRNRSIEDYLVELLALNSPIEGPSLVALVQKVRSNSTKQAVYYALQSLIQSEVVLKAGPQYLLSRVWSNRVYKLLAVHRQQGLKNEAIFSLAEREAITYRFPSLLACEYYWAHIFDLFLERMAPKSPVFVWNPHEWFAIGREKVEREVFRAFLLRGRYAFYSIHGDSLLDIKFKDEWTNKYVAISAPSTIWFSENYYLNIFGDFLLEVFLDIALAKAIDRFYRNNDKLTAQNRSEFEILIGKKYSVRMKISRNAIKAKKLRRKLAEEYLIPRGLEI